MNKFDDIAILFIGGLYPKEFEEEIVNKSLNGRQDAANAMQWKFVNGLDSLCGNVTILNAPYIGAYPKGYTDLLIKRREFSHNGISKDVNIPFCNFPVLRSLTKSITARREIRSFCKENSDRKRIAVLYALNSFTGRCAQYINNYDSNSIVCMIVPDLPLYAYNKNGRNWIYKTIIEKEIKISNDKIKYCDLLVGLTEYMHEQLDVKKAFITIDAMINVPNDSKPIVEFKGNKRFILYTGSLSFKYGIKALIEAIHSLSFKDVELHICGSGNKQVENYIRHFAEIDNRIVFHGLLSTDEVIELQRKATLLVNPRKNEGEYTKYSFPSKNAEYMASGTPCLIYRLEGISKEYYDYVFCVDDYNSLRDAIESVLSLPNEELRHKGAVAKRFIIEKKNPKTQCLKLLMKAISLFN